MQVPPAAPSGRIRAVDWLRGLAVVDMIQWHTGCVLAPELTRDALFGALGSLAGLVAASFMFAAGFAVALTMVRASGDPAARRRRALRSLQRIAEVLVVATMLKVILRRNEPMWLIKMDILTTIALSLLAAWPVLIATAARPRVAASVCLAMAVGCFATAPLAPDGTWSAIVAPASSDFPPVPWFGYVFLGAAAGALGSVGLTGTATLGVVALGFVFRYAPWHWAYADPYLLTNAGDRLILVGAVAAGLCALEREAAERGWTLAGAPFSWLDLIGSNALTAYVAHVWILFINVPVPAFSVFKVWGGRASWAGYFAILAAVLAATVVICHLWPKVTAAVSQRLRPKPAA